MGASSSNLDRVGQSQAERFSERFPLVTMGSPVERLGGLCLTKLVAMCGQTMSCLAMVQTLAEVDL